jgi:uncharacterized integral membrane protein
LGIPFTSSHVIAACSIIGLFQEIIKPFSRCAILVKVLKLGERNFYQPLTREDKVTVVLYRAGILVATIVTCFAAFVVAEDAFGGISIPVTRLGMGAALLLFYFSVGLSVFFIHLYIGKFHRVLKKIYYLAAACLAVLFVLGKGDPLAPLFGAPAYGALLLIPISLCLGFVTAKEAFCFQLMEGYILAGVMPAYLFLYSMGALDFRASVFGFCLIAALLFLFMCRKVFMPVHYDIGDKSAYQP